MKKFTLIALFAFASISQAHDELWLPDQEQTRIKKLWPASLPISKDLKFYYPTEYSQETTITNDQRWFVPIHKNSGDNPNRMAKYASPGGLARVPAHTWNSYRGIILKGGKILAFHEDFPFSGGVFDGVSRPGAASPGNLMRKVSAEYHGIEFVDVLVNDQDEVFEIRGISFDAGVPDFMTMYRDPDKAPTGYVRPKRSECAACHVKAGSSIYGPGVRGMGHIFSFRVLWEGTVQFDGRLPIEVVSDRRGPGPVPDNGVVLSEFFEPQFATSGRRGGFVRRR